ncbi:permease [Halococcoides cellulosivorans]|uniref:Permease n=2 Tax=Halococcoides cellulosivorans TaxID=1679096 RepID=A0A2R4WZU1_9EURY|nr:permease [Halococcoides cellulosivorans]
MLGTLGSAILPIVAIAGLGVLLGRTLDVDPGPLNDVAVYVLVPALVFHSLATTPLSGGTVVAILVGVVAYTAIMLAIAGGVGRLAGLTEPLLGAVVLAGVFSNAGNFGIPLSEFAFGTVGRQTAVAYIVGQSVLLYTLGAAVAARGAADRAIDAVRAILRVPLLYAVLAALVVRAFGLVGPETTGSAIDTVEMVGVASIPIMLLVLGIQLERVDVSATLRVTVTPALLKLAVAPVVAIAIALTITAVAPAVFADPTVARVFVLECAAPSAVTPVILIGEFGPETPAEPTPAAIASATILVTTLASVPLLTLLIPLLESGTIL